MSAPAIILIILASLLGLLLILLASPVGLAFWFDLPENGGGATVSWLWGAVRFHPGKKDEEKAREKRAKRKPKKRKGIKNPRALLDERLFRAALRILGRLTRRIEIHRLTIRLAFGLEDPADTGAIYGRIFPLILTLRQMGVRGLSRARLNVEPCFDLEVLELQGAGRISLVPLLVVATAVGAFLRRDGWIVLGAIRRAMWSTRKA